MLMMDWSYSPQASRQNYTTSLNVEPREETRREGNRENTWRRDLEADVKETAYNWRQLERLHQGRKA